MNHSPLNQWLMRTAGDALGHAAARRLCVVNYHRILAAPDPLLESEPDVATFRWQMSVLAGSFNVLPLSEAVAAVREDRLPPRAVCITFDDGYRSVHDLALPVLREFKLPATVFVTSGHLGESNMWNDRIIEAVQTLPANELDLSPFGLGRYPLASLDERKRSLAGLTEASKYLPPAQRRRLVGHLENMVGDQLSHGLMLTPEMVVNLDRHGVEIGAHTITHPILSKLDDAAAAREIAGSKHELEDLIGKPVRMFAYPNGKVGKDYDARHVAMVQKAGFDAAFTTAVGAISRGQDRFQLPRSRPWDGTPFLFGLRLLRWMAQGETK
jgi:peptidoglycan/xylan/chitin deacetylase (PgdA/CDA1 family)